MHCLLLIYSPESIEYIATLKLTECVGFDYSVKGDEIIAINHRQVQGLNHAETITIFKTIREGQVVLNVARRRYI